VVGGEEKVVVRTNMSCAGPPGLGRGNGPTATVACTSLRHGRNGSAAEDLDPFVIRIIDDRVESMVSTNASQFIKRGFMLVESRGGAGSWRLGSSGGGELGDYRGHELFAGVVRGGALGFELVDDGHELVHLRDDAALLGEGGDG
jgi:hypothetical protein